MKRLLAFLLTVAMLLSLPITVFAEGEGSADSTIKVSRVNSVNTTVSEDGTVTIKKYNTEWNADWTAVEGETTVTWSVSPADVLSIEPHDLNRAGHQSATVYVLNNKSNATITVTDKNGNTDSINIYVDAPEITVTYLEQEGGTELQTINYVAASYLQSLPKATRDNYKFDGWYFVQFGRETEWKKIGDMLFSSLNGSKVYAKWTPTYTVDDNTYDTLNEALENAAEKTEITVPADAETVALDDAKTLTVPAGGSVKVESKADNGSASAKELTITKPDNTSETAYLVTVGGTTSAVKSSNIDNEVVAQDSSGNTLSGKEAAAQLFDIPKVLAGFSATANTAIADVDFLMKATDEGVTQKAGHDKTFEVHPYATDGTTEYEVPADALKAQKYSVTLDLGVANAGMYARLTHYKSDSSAEVLGTYPIGSDGKVNFTMNSFSPVGADVIYAEDDATFTLTVDAPDTINVDTEFDVEVKLTSTVDTNLNTMTFSYGLPEGFTETETGKTGYLTSAEKQSDGTWVWDAANGGGNIVLSKDTAVSLGTIKVKVAQADAEYNVDKTFTFGPANLTFSGVAGTEKATTLASDSTKVTTTYAITWDYNGGKLDNADNKTDTVGVNEMPTAPAPVKSGYTLGGWTPTVGKATANVTYTANWTLDTSGMSVVFKDYGYAYLNGEDSTDYDQLLVLKAPTPADGYAYAIDGSLMFATTEANYRGLVSAAENETVYVYLVNGTMTAENVLGATPKLSVVAGTNTTIARDGDLYRDSSVKQGDLGVLVDLYNNRSIYGRTGAVDVRARLEADIDNSADADHGFKSIADINALIRILFPASGS